VSFPATSVTSWSKLNALYKENAAASYQAIQDAQAYITLLSPPNSPNFIFPETASDYVYNPLLTIKKHNATPPPIINYTLLKLAEEALHHQQIKDGSSLLTLLYPDNALVTDKDILDEELPPPQVFTPVTTILSSAPE
jgi:hypothetical protein